MPHQCLSVGAKWQQKAVCHLIVCSEAEHVAFGLVNRYQAVKGQSSLCRWNMMVNLAFLLFTQLCGRWILDDSTHATNSLSALLMAWGGLVLVHENILRYQQSRQTSSVLKSSTSVSTQDMPSQTVAGGANAGSDSSYIWDPLVMFMEMVALSSIGAGCLLQVALTGVWTALGWSIALLLTDAARLVRPHTSLASVHHCADFAGGFLQVLSGSRAAAPILEPGSLQHDRHSGLHTNHSAGGTGL